MFNYKQRSVTEDYRKGWDIIFEEVVLEKGKQCCKHNQYKLSDILNNALIHIGDTSYKQVQEH